MASSLLDLAAELEAVFQEQDHREASPSEVRLRVKHVALELRRRATSTAPQAPQAPLKLRLSQFAEVRAADACADPTRLAADLRSLQARVVELEAQLAKASPDPGVAAPGSRP